MTKEKSKEGTSTSPKASSSTDVEKQEIRCLESEIDNEPLEKFKEKPPRKYIELGRFW